MARSLLWSGVPRLWVVRSCGVLAEDHLAEELEACAAVHGSFDELEAVFPSFGGSVAVGQREGVVDGVVVS